MASQVLELPSFERLQSMPHTSPRAAGATASTLDAAHPLRRLWQTHVRAVSGVHIPRSSLLARIYDSPTVASFFARAARCNVDITFDHLGETSELRAAAHAPCDALHGMPALIGCVCLCLQSDVHE